MYYSTSYLSPLGKIIIAGNHSEISGLWFENQKYFLGSLSDEILTKDDLPVFQSVKKWLDEYFSGNNPDPSWIPLSPLGSDFRQTVWKILCRIPYGSVITYNEIAKIIADEQNIPKMSAQAVGGAVGHNPISILIPCHRVVGSNGSLTGYAGGINRKIELLKLEGVDVSKFSLPKKGTAL